MPNSELNLPFCSGLCILNKHKIDGLKEKKKEVLEINTAEKSLGLAPVNQADVRGVRYFILLAS